MSDKVSILLIDDEAIVGKRLKPALEDSGYDVETYQQGKTALERIQEKAFDIVVTDMRIDEVNGLDVLRAAQARSGKTKVVLITGYATMELAREALSKGAFEVLAKPFRPQELREIIGRAASASKALAAHT